MILNTLSIDAAFAASADLAKALRSGLCREGNFVHSLATQQLRSCSCIQSDLLF